jgi:hypothetical protein
MGIDTQEAESNTAEAHMTNNNLTTVLLIT